MKILLTGGGTGGHFYPIISVCEAIFDLCEEERIIHPRLIFMSDSIYDKEIVTQMGISFKKVRAGKIRRYFSILNILDIFKTFLGAAKALFLVYSEMPDVIFAKGGYSSFPALLAGRILGIPIFLHESDAIPGKVNSWFGKSAKRIAISFEEAGKYFSKEKTAFTGVPIRKEITGRTPEEGREAFSLENGIKTILVLGGSQGSQNINDTLLNGIEELLKTYQIIHQCGQKNETEVRSRSEVILDKSQFKSRYHLKGFMNAGEIRNASSCADLVVSRAGATAIYEIAAWGTPSIMIPLKNSAQNHQKANAYEYSKKGAAEVVEESNLSPHVLISEINRIFSSPEASIKMADSAKKFSKPEAARKIAQEIINLALEHSA
ncbi:MAG: undecaprenyldiphospho-muramoylpentapeptide beta-N-acetylglucosaminyltransferase [Candidatus Pacebacteria bacterium]|nr:undecaprenyldiphospho-muramoylpentapeptide beta-N-acetylglucosaminyltransferase [Candidatus Paceibacterota bacterium]